MTLVTELGRELSTLGFSGSIKTLEELFSWLRHIKVTHIPKLLRIKDTIWSFNSIQYTIIKESTRGKFGVLYLASRHDKQNPQINTYIYLKVSPKYPESLLIEGIIQSIAHTTLKTYGFPMAVPRVLDIVKHPEDGYVLSIHRCPEAQLFADYLRTNLTWDSPSILNDKLIFSGIAQVATYLAILESTIGLNHRDIKSTNVLMVIPSSPWYNHISLHSHKWWIRGTYQAVLIDFGFACIGKPNGKSIISAGEYLTTIDFCPKKGRDLFLFFAGLWNIPVFRSCLTDAGQALFQKWLRDTSDTKWADWLVTSSHTNLESMYLLTNSDHFTSEACSPLNVLHDISNVYSDILQFQ
jgi:serine/threonine protein kinase